MTSQTSMHRTKCAEPKNDTTFVTTKTIIKISTVETYSLSKSAHEQLRNTNAAFHRTSVNCQTILQKAQGRQAPQPIDRCEYQAPGLNLNPKDTMDELPAPFRFSCTGVPRCIEGSMEHAPCRSPSFC